MSTREVLTVETAAGTLGAAGEGTPVLLVHGGPGLGYEYLEGLEAELAAGYRIAVYQQRGLEPSTLEGPFTIAQAIADVLAVLDALEWSRALIVGHSWGGQLALRFVAAHPERLLGALVVDPLGVVGDGGMAAFEAELLARTPKAGRERARELDERAMAGEGTAEEGLESLRIVWPAHFADPENAPEMPPIRVSLDAYSGLIDEVTTGLDEVAGALAKRGVPDGRSRCRALPVARGSWLRSCRTAATAPVGQRGSKFRPSRGQPAAAL